MITKQVYKKLKKLSIEMHALLGSTHLRDDEVYDLIFPKYISEVRTILPGFTWCDRDMDYKDDVIAFVSAVDAELDLYKRVKQTLDYVEE